MARLEDKGKRGLPPPPAPTRRSANPWPFSDTARRRQPPRVEDLAQPEEPTQAENLQRELLEGLILGSAKKRESPQPASTMPPPGQGPAKPASHKSLTKPRRRGRFWPLLALLFMAGIVIKVVSEAGMTGEWRRAFPALIAIAFIAHGWWRSRKRREEREASGEDGNV